MIIPTASSVQPSGWLYCFGQTVSRSTYSALFTALGTTYGVGDGSTTFGLPDLRGRVLAGKDNMGGTAANRITSGGSGIVGTTLGAVGGTETHTLTTAQLAVHTHIQDAHAHSASSYIRVGGIDDLNMTGNGDWVTDSDAGERGTRPTYTTVNANTATNQNAGSGAAHPNAQPTMVVNYLIKT
jgi:microcystin-dependent protein